MPIEPWQGGPAYGYGPKPWQQGMAQPWQYGMRAAHTDRERTLDILRAAYGEGRLDADEHQSRTELVLAAKTYGELSQLVSDLPTGPMGMTAQQGMPTQQGAMQPLPPTFRPMPAPPETNSMAVGSLICGLVQPFCLGVSAVPAVILGHVSRSQVRQTEEEGDGMATAGLVLGWLGIAFWMMIFMMMGVVG